MKEVVLVIIVPLQRFHVKLRAEQTYPIHNKGTTKALYLAMGLHTCLTHHDNTSKVYNAIHCFGLLVSVT